MGCLLCNAIEPNFNPNADTDYICSKCVQILLAADQEDLKKAHAKAIEKGYSNKARAIESFLIPEEINVRETKQARRSLVRKGHMRKVRPSRNQLRPQSAAL